MTERPQPRPMTGFLATLTPEQLAAALAYDGPDTMIGAVQANPITEESAT